MRYPGRLGFPEWFGRVKDGEENLGEALRGKGEKRVVILIGELYSWDRVVLLLRGESLTLLSIIHMATDPSNSSSTHLPFLSYLQTLNLPNFHPSIRIRKSSESDDLYGKDKVGEGVGIGAEIETESECDVDWVWTFGGSEWYGIIRFGIMYLKDVVYQQSLSDLARRVVVDT